MDAETLALLTRLSPELMNALRERAMALSRIAALQPIGRRALSQKLGLPEREVRALCDSMKRDGLIDAGASGMVLTTMAMPLVESARELSRRALDIVALEQTLMEALQADEVAVAAGDADRDAEVLREVGQIAAERIVHLVRDGMILAVSGGGTVAAVAAALPRGAHMDIDVLPARGGMGGSVELQADTLAAEFARRLGGRYALLHLPDAIPAAALEALMRLPEVRGPLTAMRKADLLIHGIGRADVMALKRNLPEEDVRELLECGAAAEAMGAYFTVDGTVLKRASGIGFLSEQGGETNVVAVAAGASKAEAIWAVSRHHRHRLIVTDEGAARAMMALHCAVEAQRENTSISSSCVVS